MDLGSFAFLTLIFGFALLPLLFNLFLALVIFRIEKDQSGTGMALVWFFIVFLFGILGAILYFVIYLVKNMSN